MTDIGMQMSEPTALTDAELEMVQGGYRKYQLTNGFTPTTGVTPKDEEIGVTPKEEEIGFNISQ